MVVVSPEKEEHIRAEFGMFSLDEKAGKEALDFKGAGAAKPCFKCRNVLGALSWPGDSEYLVRYECPDRRRWHMHTPQSLMEFKEKLDATAREAPGDLDELQLMLGLKRNEHGVLWDPYLATLVKAPKCMYYDAMHCLFSSGGIAQFQTNTFVQELLHHNLTLQDIDKYAQNVRGHQLSKDFFSTRVALKRNTTIKAFASEVIDCVNVLTLLAVSVVAVNGVMADHVRCMQLLYVIVNILLDPENILLNVDNLENALEEHQILHSRLHKTVPKKTFSTPYC